MKIILRERTTGLWLKPCGRWEPTSVNAREFGTSEEAVQCSIALHFPNVDVCFAPEGAVMNDPNQWGVLLISGLRQRAGSSGALSSPKN